VDARRQTRIAVADRKPGLIHADLAGALTLTHKRSPSTAGCPTSTTTHSTTQPPGPSRRSARSHPGRRCQQQATTPPAHPRRIPEAPPGVEPVTRNRVQRRRHGDRADHHRDPPTNRPASPARWDATQHRHPCHTPVGATMSIGSMLYGAGLSAVVAVVLVGGLGRVRRPTVLITAGVSAFLMPLWWARRVRHCSPPWPGRRSSAGLRSAI